MLSIQEKSVQSRWLTKVDVQTEDREDEEKRLLWYAERSYLDATNGLKQRGNQA